MTINVDDQVQCSHVVASTKHFSQYQQSTKEPKRTHKSKMATVENSQSGKKRQNCEVITVMGAFRPTFLPIENLQWELRAGCVPNLKVLGSNPGQGMVGFYETQPARSSLATCWFSMGKKVGRKAPTHDSVLCPSIASATSCIKTHFFCTFVFYLPPPIRFKKKIFSDFCSRGLNHLILNRKRPRTFSSKN